jgi:hypothetical protein
MLMLSWENPFPLLGLKMRPRFYARKLNTKIELPLSLSKLVKFEIEIDTERERRGFNSQKR